VETAVRINQVLWGVLFCLSGCGPPVIESDVVYPKYVAFVPGRLQPDNCGTPDHYERCPPSRVRRRAVGHVRTFVTIEEIGGTPAQEAKIFPTLQ
jgi:hypothetical protein